MAKVSHIGSLYITEFSAYRLDGQRVRGLDTMLSVILGVETSEMIDREFQRYSPSQTSYPNNCFAEEMSSYAFGLACKHTYVGVSPVGHVSAIYRRYGISQGNLSPIKVYIKRIFEGSLPAPREDGSFHCWLTHVSTNGVLEVTKMDSDPQLISTWNGIVYQSDIIRPTYLAA